MWTDRFRMLDPAPGQIGKQIGDGALRRVNVAIDDGQALAGSGFGEGRVHRAVSFEFALATAGVNRG